MKATDLDLSEGLSFDVDAGVTTFEQTRMLVLSADSIGLLRQELIEEVGPAHAREVFLRVGFQMGHADYYQLKTAYDFDTDVDLLGAGPVMHAYEGTVRGDPTEMRIDPDAGEFYFAGVWRNSYEAEQHLSFNEPADEPVCWSLMGYASGYATAFLGEPVLGYEPACVGAGDDQCEWVLKPLDEWDETVAAYAAALEPYFDRERATQG